MTQEELAERLLVSPKTISNWKNGKTTPDLESLISLAKMFDFSLDKLLLKDPATVSKMNHELRRGRNIIKYIVHAVLITVFVCVATLMIYEECTKHYRKAYEEYMINEYVINNE